MVDLVLGRAVEDMFEPRAKREPDMGVAQVGSQGVEQQHQVAHPEQGIGAHGAATQPVEGAGVEGKTAPLGQHLAQLLHQMDAARCRRHHDGRAVVYLVKLPEPATVEGAVQPVMHQIADEKDAQTVEHHQPARLGQPGTLPPHPGQGRLDILRLQQPGVEQGQDRQDQRHMEQRPHQIVLVVEQSRGVQPDGPAPEETAKAAGAGISLAASIAIEQVGDRARDQQEGDTQAPIEIEQSCEAVPERRDQPPLHGVKEKGQSVHGVHTVSVRAAAF